VRIGLDILSEVAGRSSGSETYLQGFLKGLASINNAEHNFFLFVNSGCEEFYHPPDERFHQVHFPFSNRRRPLRVLSQLSLIPYHSRRLKLDVVNFLGTTGAPFVGCASVQHIKTLHHLEIPGAVDFRSEAFRKLAVGPSARLADVVVANCGYIRDAATRVLGIPPERIVTVPEAVDHATFYPQREQDQFKTTLAKYRVQQPYLLFVSSLWPHKNAHGLIEAYAILLSRFHVPHTLVIVGGLPKKNYYQELSRRAKSHGLESKVQFVGHMTDRHEIRDLYVGADVFAYPSYLETFGLTLLESMACGTPVVAANRGSIPEVAGDAALLVDPDDHVELANAIWTLLTDRSKREIYIARGLGRAQEFTWERTAGETLRAYELAVQFSRREHNDLAPSLPVASFENNRASRTDNR
jgi:glycosyltransferase involved in cell wall biosynthesis